MRWAARNKKKKDRTKYYKWFAWYPVWLYDTKEWCWLEVVYKRKESVEVTRPNMIDPTIIMRENHWVYKHYGEI